MTNSGSFGEVDNHVQAVMDLVEKRAVGAASNEDVEAAVQQLLQQKPNEGEETKKGTKQSTKTCAATTKVVQDTENYDDDDEEEEVQRKPPPKRQRKAKPVNTSLYDDIPLGLQGAQMLTTFGDGRQPHPTTVAAVLTGTRLMLHVAIQDARHMRRRNVEWYKQAHQKVTGTMPSTPTKKLTNTQESTEILYRAIDRRDPLAYTEKCGFAVTDLQTLFPEEMNAFTRFNEMHAETEAAEKSTEVPATEKEETAPQKSIVVIDDNVSHSDGHLKDRAANFDVRTRKMHEDWYFQYCELRQGSFLPRRCKKKDQPQGLTDDWTGLSLQQVRFLHWIGFDPQSPLPPPSDDTTDALAFLGYDFVGRIVEKAIFFRLLQKREADTTTIVLELNPGDQLEESDIQKAMDDLRPSPIYASSSNSDGRSRRTQLPGSHPLFFGNGFENRLELEIEEFMLERKLTPEELEIRKEEENLFATIAKAPPPPPKESVTSYKKKQHRKK